MRSLESEYLYTMKADLRQPWVLSGTPLGTRKIWDVTAGTVSGRVNGKVLPSGGDWMLDDADGTSRLDVRAAIELDDGFIAYCTYQGRISVPPDVAAEMTSHEAAAAIDPTRYYFRVAPTFETASEKYHWLNRIQAVGIGRITATGVAYDLFEVL